jgi:hypothetical protein
MQQQLQFRGKKDCAATGICACRTSQDTNIVGCDHPADYINCGKPDHQEMGRSLKTISHTANLLTGKENLDKSDEKGLYYEKNSLNHIERKTCRNRIYKLLKPDGNI